EEKLILSVGLPIKRKGILDFVELAKRFPTIQFIWFGYMDPRFLPKEISAALQTDLPNLQFPGYINRDALRVAYQACDLYIFLTHEETEGIVLLEALASKTDTLIRDISVFNPEYVDAVNVYKGKDIEQFQTIIEDLFQEQIPSVVNEVYQATAKKSIPSIGSKLQMFYLKVLQQEPQKYFTNKE